MWLVSEHTSIQSKLRAPGEGVKVKERSKADLRFGFSTRLAFRSRPFERSIDGFGSWIGGLRCWEWGFGS